MANENQEASGNHKVNGEKSHMTVKDPSVHSPLNVAKNSGATSNGIVKHTDTLSSRRSEIRRATTTTATETDVSFSKDQQITVLHDTTSVCWSKFVTDFDHVDEQYIDNMSIDVFLECIERQRLTYMPHQGSKWDKILKFSEYFGLRLSNYAKAVESFVPNSETAAKLMWTGCCALLELGPENAKALETTFGVFYELGLSLSVLLRHDDILYANNHIRMEVAQAYNGMLILVQDVSTYYYAKLNSTSAVETSLDFTSLFQGQIQGFYSRKKHITDAMWKYKLGEDESIEVSALRSWLGPPDRVLKRLHKGKALTPEHRDEYTCEWFQRRLLDFTRSQDDILATVGPEGCGKTYLSRWIVERLQRPLGKKTHETLSYSIEADTIETTTSFAVARSLALQLFEGNIGDESLFHALVKAYDLSKHVTTKKTEDALWKALDTGIDRFAGTGRSHLMIIIDGLDELQNSEKVMSHLGRFTSKHKNVQAITLSRNPVPNTAKGRIQTFQVKPDNTLEDLRHVADHALRGYDHYKVQSDHRQETIVEQLIHTAQGNFLWLLLTIYFIRKESSHEAFEKVIKATKEAPQSLHQLLKKTTEGVDLSRSDTNLVLSWMLVAERPLTLTEVKTLLQIDLQKKHTVERKTNIRNDIQTALGPLIIFQNEFVRFRHSSIRNYLIDLQSSGTTKLLDLRSAHHDFATRLLAYCKFNVNHHHEPSFEVISRGLVHELFSQHVLLEYAVRSWIRHFHASTKHTGQSLEISNDTKNLFPGTTTMALLEWACWSPWAVNNESYHLALRVRESIFGEKHECVLQSLIICGTYSQKLANQSEAGNFFYRASQVGQFVLRPHHTLTLTCASTFLAITEFVTSTTRTELISRKEETIRYVIEVRKRQHGKTHDLTIKYYQMLARLYVEIHEEHKAEVVWRELREIIVMRFGKGSEEETSISEQLIVVLKKGEKKTDVVEYENDLFDMTTELEIWDIRRIQLTLELAFSYEARKELFRAEELYISLWNRLTERCHHDLNDHGVEIHIYMIDVALEYARFLQRCNRLEEACNILICVWTEYEEYDFESETLFLRLKSVGELMRDVSLFSVAVLVLKKCWNWFESRGKIDYKTSCEVLISEIVHSIITTTSKTTASTSIATSTTTSSSTETIVREVFESTLTRKEVTMETISICKSLVSFYMKSEQYSQAMEIAKRSLCVIWKFVVSGNGTTALPQHHGAGAIDIAMSLAFCYHQSHNSYEAEEIYVRIYRACRNSCHMEDEGFVRSYETIIKFYEEHHHWQKAIHIYQELLVQYRKTLGTSHKLTIRTLYILGSLCAEHGHGVALEYYNEIVTVLNGGSRICHADAVDAMIIVCRMHYEAGHWHKLSTVCKVLWETWRDQHHGRNKFSADFVEVLYLRYRYVLEHHEVCEYSVLRLLTIEYRNACLKVFGASAAITIKASIELAEINMRSETHIQEAISVYEEVLTTTKTTTTITKIKESLTTAYISICSRSSVSTNTIERAITIVNERFEFLKVSLGCAHIETLICLRELVVMQMKLKIKDSHAITVRTLVDLSVEIIKKERHSKILHEAAKFLGDVFVTCGLTEQGRTMVEDMRVQIITGTSPKGTSDFGFDSSIGKVSYVFLVTFEQVIREQVVSYSEIMADLLSETYFYESYHRCIKSKEDTTIILTHAARLRAFLLSHHRTAQKELLQRESFEIFIKKWESAIKRRDDISFTLYLGLLSELEHDVRNVSIANAACAAGVRTVKELLNRGDNQKAYEVASCALDFINNQRAFHNYQNVPYGFKLSALMVGRGLDKPLSTDINSKLRDSMSELSRRTIRDVLKACKDSMIDFVRLQLHELSELAGLLGEQQNYADLEWLLDLLWSSREVQKKWETDTIIAIGRSFVTARYLHQDHRSRAIRLCEDICYNLRRVWGSLDPKALEMSELLSELYTSMGHYREAQGVHENILRLVVDGDDGDDRTLDTMPSATARKHLELLKQTYLRLKGWDKSTENYKELVDGLITLYKGKPEWKDVSSIDTWNFNKERPSETLGKFITPKDWEFASSAGSTRNTDTKESRNIRRPGQGVKRATSNWGIGDGHRALHGLPEKAITQSNGNGHSPRKPVVLDDDDGYESAVEEPTSRGVKV